MQKSPHVDLVQTSCGPHADLNMQTHGPHAEERRSVALGRARIRSGPCPGESPRGSCESEDQERTHVRATHDPDPRELGLYGGRPSLRCWAATLWAGLLARRCWAPPAARFLRWCRRGWTGGQRRRGPARWVRAPAHACMAPVHNLCMHVACACVYRCRVGGMLLCHAW